jgi:hypothetical protein
MSRRPHGSKPTIAFWMLVAIADAAMLVAAAGPAVSLMVPAAVALVFGGVLVARRMSRERVPAKSWLITQRTVSPSEVVARRRA